MAGIFAGSMLLWERNAWLTKKDNLDQLAQYMFNGQVSLLNILGIGARHSDYYFRYRGQATSISREGNRVHISFFCCGDSADDVR
jgi:hypothetical protein